MGHSLSLARFSGDNGLDIQNRRDPDMKLASGKCVLPKLLETPVVACLRRRATEQGTIIVKACVFPHPRLYLPRWTDVEKSMIWRTQAHPSQKLLSWVLPYLCYEKPERSELTAENQA
jgi:hypothetical protein